MHNSRRVDAVMVRPALSIDLESAAGAALKLFAAHPIHHLPVVSGQRVVGMLSSADMLKLEAFLPKNRAVADEYLNRRMSVASLLRRPVVTIGPSASLAEAVAVMATHAIHALPVVDEVGRLLGIITTTDIMRALLQGVPEEAVAGAAVSVRDADSSRAGTIQDLRLSESRFEQAVVAAEKAVQSRQDPLDIAEALLILRRRSLLLERVLRSADRYLHGGEDPPLHAALRKAIDEAKRMRPNGDVEEAQMLGLSGE